MFNTSCRISPISPYNLHRKFSCSVNPGHKFISMFIMKLVSTCCTRSHSLSLFFPPPLPLLDLTVTDIPAGSNFSGFFHLLLLFLIINVSSLGDVNIWKYTDEATEPSHVFARSMIKGAWRDYDWASVYRARDGHHGELSSNILDKSGVMAEWKILVSDIFTYFLILFPNIFFSSTGVNLFCPVTIHCFYWPKEKN